MAFAWLSSRKAQDGRAPPRRTPGADRVTAAVTGLASLAALAVALAFPAAYLLSAVDRLSGVLEVSAQHYADTVSDVASENPQLYNAFLSDSEAHLDGLAIAAPDDPAAGRPPQRRQVFARDGRLLLDVAPSAKLLWPVLSSSAPVLQNGHPLGLATVSGSMRAQAVTGLMIGLGSFTLGAFLLAGLRIVPLRLMNEALERASFLSAHDQLTGLPNRALLAARLDEALANSARAGGKPVAMHCLDLDHFKQVNDTLGHGAGDALLRTVSQRLRACLRSGDTLARLGGDEFAVVQIGVEAPEHAGVLASRLIEAVRAPVIIDGHRVFVGLSVGLALSTPGVDAAEITKQADIALYQAKAAGRGGFCYFAPEMNAKVMQRNEIENDLRLALERGQLLAHYQPQIDLETGAIVGAEALMRWDRPGHGYVPPLDFIPIAEETGLIVPMGAWLLRETCREAATWPQPIRIAVNVSPIQFRDPDFYDIVRDALTRSGLDPRRLELEVTEGILIHDTQETLAILAQLRALGVRLAMDDFGTGYSSLGYLQKFRFDKIKIDRAFVKNLGADIHADAIVRAVVGMGQALGIATNAEGVESVEQAAMLRAHGCREGQGFLYSRPLPAASLRSLFAAPRKVA